MRSKPELMLFSLFLVYADQVSALDIVTPEEFEALTEGKTLYFTEDGLSYGAEQYLANRRVRWQYPDGSCLEGRWFSEGDALCFRYEDQPDTQCWIMWREHGRTLARRTGSVTDRAIELVRKDELPLPCAGPDLGV